MDIDAKTLVDIGAGSTLTASSVDLDASVTKLDGHARAKSTSYSPIFFGLVTAFSRAKVDIDSDTEVNVRGSTTRVTGIRGVDMQARQSGIIVTRDAWQLAVALIPPQNSFAEGTVNLDSVIDTAADAVVTAGARDNSRAGDDLAADKSGLRDNSVLGQSMALYAQAIVTPWTPRYPGKAGDGGTNDDSGTVRWDADVVILGGLQGAAELVINADGDVVRANAILVDGAIPVVGEAADSNDDGTIDVQVTNGGNAGVLFYADNVIRNDSTPGTNRLAAVRFQGHPVRPQPRRCLR